MAIRPDFPTDILDIREKENTRGLGSAIVSPYVGFRMTTLVCYHLPSDRDDAEHPNAFVIKKFAEDVTLKDVKALFPLPGEYHFRFKTRFESSTTYWVDATDDAARVPLFASNKIVAKVLRLSWTSAARPVSPQIASPKPVPNNHRKMDDLFGGSNSPPKPARISNIGDLDLFG